ncbi:uncharacterized protein LOC120328528 [Styela clava]
MDKENDNSEDSHHYAYPTVVFKKPESKENVQKPVNQYENIPGPKEDHTKKKVKNLRQLSSEEGPSKSQDQNNNAVWIMYVAIVIGLVFTAITFLVLLQEKEKLRQDLTETERRLNKSEVNLRGEIALLQKQILNVAGEMSRQGRNIGNLQNSSSENKKNISSLEQTYKRQNSEILAMKANLNKAAIPVASVRLITDAGATSTVQGRVEILHQGIWGNICTDDFSNEDARVICRMLGYTDAGGRTGNNYRVGSTAKFWLNRLLCTGQESNIGLCPHGGWNWKNCINAVSVHC